MGRAIGIDLGTTNSCAAVIEDGRPRVITHKGGERTIPSVFAVDESGRELVGHEARRQAQLNPANTIMASKRLIGRNFHSKTIDRIRQIFTYEMLEGDNSEVLVKVRDRVFTLEQISAAIIRRIREVAEEALGEEVDQAVITVPAYFNDRQRQAVRNAGRLAGLKVLRILNEPTAAALAYGMGRNLNQRVAVYDLGGGTFDISIIDIKDRIFEVIATGGDTFLGGVDFDDRLMQHVLEDFLERHHIDLAWDRVAVQRIRDAAEAAKIELSTVRRTRIHIPFITQGDDGPLAVDIEITRELLEDLTRDLVERTIRTCERILAEAGTSPDQVDEVLLVGGQSRMPLVRRMVAEFMGRRPSRGVNPDEAVGIGAAIMAHSLASRAPSDVTLLDVLPMPIGINKVDGTMHVLFQKNQPLPDYKTRTLTTTKDNQRSIMLRLYQGESRKVADNELLGTFIFSGIRPAPKGQVRLEVTFHIDSEGILSLTARDRDTGQIVESRLKLGRKKKKRRARPAGEAAAPAERPAAPAESAPTERDPSEEPTVPPDAGSAPAAPAPLEMPRSRLADRLAGEGGAEAPADAEASADAERPTQVDEPPAATGKEAGAPAEGGGLWQRVMGWFRGLFGG